uniref:Uncharacterized protein n=1 Tax=Ursus maritimus TaxID=29073 RepID=A0A452TUB2_URSMA
HGKGEAGVTQMVNDLAGVAGGPKEAAENPVETKTVSSSNGGGSSSGSADMRSAEAAAPKISTFGLAAGRQTSDANALSVSLDQFSKHTYHCHCHPN